MIGSRPLPQVFPDLFPTSSHTTPRAPATVTSSPVPLSYGGEEVTEPSREEVGDHLFTSSPRRDEHHPLTCASCGNYMARGTGSLPQGQARCQPCRRASPDRHTNRECVDCRVPISNEATRCIACHRTRVAVNRRPRKPLNTRAWRKLRDQVIFEEPLCRIGLFCCTGWSQTADHIEPVSQRPDLKMERANLRGACHPCNDTRKAIPDEHLRRVLWWAA